MRWLRFGHRRHHGKRATLRKRFDYGPERNFTIRVFLYGTMLANVVVLLIVKLVTHQ